ncbi:N-acetyllactosaminide beta-1,6-N-acetylglucosaminyl-transferase-like [Littorina saxatilis]|uniref:N-acetyllactosaminide beta-1,6-N-acetylglucosaminyl-transferase-like n=1 Tax=Littorina saxatilis TaxID=31220 RepID=UPI0038B6626B
MDSCPNLYYTETHSKVKKLACFCGLHKLFHFRWKNSKPVPYNLTISKGDVHVLASREYVDYVTNSRVAHELLEWLRYSFIPDESFFRTLNHNPQLGVPGSYLGPIEGFDKHTLRSYKIWDFYQNHPCAGKFIRNICQLGVGDLPRLTSSPFLIANKFLYDYQPLAYDCLEKWYFDKVRLENLGLAESINVSLYENSDIVKLRYTGLMHPKLR